MAQRVADHTISVEDLEKEHKLKSKDSAKRAGAAETSAAPARKKSSRQKKVRGKNYKEAKSKIQKAKNKSPELPVKDAVKSVHSAAYAQFPEAVELHIVLGIDPKNSDHKIRFTTSLPHGTGKKVKALVISDDKKDAIKDIESGKLSPGKDFDIVIATPGVMKDLAKIARILGPKGLMPSPKNNTVTDKPEAVVKELQKGQIEIRNQPGHSVIQVLVGNLKFKDEQIVENIQHILGELQKNSPGKLKKKFIQKAYICTTMGPSVRINV